MSLGLGAALDGASPGGSISAEVRERAVGRVLANEEGHESQWATIQSIAGKIGRLTEALRRWMRQTERDRGRRPGLTTAERERLRVLEREQQL